MITAKDLTKKFGSKTAVDGLSFTVPQGKVTGFLGPNGSGKSTTMRMMVGLDRPSSGSVTIKGVQYSALTRPMNTVGAMLDASWIHPTRTARAHLAWIAASQGFSRHRVKQLLDYVGLASEANTLAGKFSLGMRQRLGLAAAMLGEPEVLIFDEPSNGLDPEGIYWMRATIRELAREGRTVLVSSHMLGEMALVADHLLVIGKGRLLADTSVERFIADHTDRSVMVRTPEPEELGQVLLQVGAQVSYDDSALYVAGFVDGYPVSTDWVGEVAHHAGVPVWELTMEHAGLEEAFMNFTGEHVQYAAAAPPSLGLGVLDQPPAALDEPLPAEDNEKGSI